MNKNRTLNGRHRVVALGAGLAVVAVAGVSAASTNARSASAAEAATIPAQAAVVDVTSAAQPEAVATTEGDRHSIVEYVPQTGVPVAQADAEPLRPIAADLDMEVERLGVERGEFDLGFIDGSFVDPATGTFVTFTVDPNARGIPWEFSVFDSYERQDIDGAIFLTKEDSWNYSVVAQNADGSTVTFMTVSRSEGDSESYSRDVKDGAVQLLLPELLAVSVG